MRSILVTASAILLLGACNTIDGIGKDMGAVGQSFGNLFDNSVQNSRRMRDTGSGGLMGMSSGSAPAMAPRPQMQAPRMNPNMGGMGGGQYGGAMGGASPYGASGGAGGAYGMGGMGNIPPMYPQQYQQQPRQPAMPYYYNEGY